MIRSRGSQKVPFTILGCLLLLNVIGLAALYSSLHQAGEFVGQSIFFKQIVWITIAWLVLLIFSSINYRLYFDLAYVLYIVNIILLLVVIWFGKKGMGAQRWISIMGFTFQPSELSKVVIIFNLARLFSLRTERLQIKTVAIALFLVGVNALLIFKQPDLGTASILVFLFFIIGLSSKVKKRYFISLILIGLIAVPFVWGTLKSYQKKRLIVFINPDVEPLGAGYTITQSKIAIGSGKIAGKGFLAGTQNQFNFLPERHTDFIFTVIAEEWGFIGALFLLLIYWMILRKILDMAADMKDEFSKLLAVGISAFLFLHVFINIGMTLGILPVVGLPLIFLSYGGSNLLSGFILMGILLNICRND